ncbi:DMT family transporter [Pediococcus ethanolidurans]|uniref:DMT family transporter n=2 Tax=Pediococcus ethanolidurans TaxID=319653 RepID=UPI0021E75993|nr:DMT family transporter [Pediococcus ethanolidurans]MCV3555797.1 DMT family transporter [Pediococcus ethanolidurans]
MGLSAYGYIVTWLYLPIFLIFLSIYLFKKRLLTGKPIKLYFFLVLFLVIPLIYFAYCIFIRHISQPTKFFWFDISPLPMSRTSSLINFSGNIFSKMFINFLKGLTMYLSGNDGLNRNTIAPFGIICPWILVFFATTAIFVNRRFLPSRTELLRNICRIALLAFLPVSLVVLPNYTHWNLIHIPLLVLSGLGIYVVMKWLPNCQWKATTLLIIILPMIFFAFLYFQPTSIYRTGNVRQLSMKNIERVSRFMKERKKDRLFTYPLSRNFTYFRIYQTPIDHKKYLALQEKKREFQVPMGPQKKYGYLRDTANLESEYRPKYDYVLTMSKLDAIRIERHYHVRLRTVKKYQDGVLVYSLNKIIR